jgi:hypothetical protein
MLRRPREGIRGGLARGHRMVVPACGRCVPSSRLRASAARRDDHRVGHEPATGTAGNAQARCLDADPLFYERQRRRASTWDIPRFLRSYDETLTGDLIVPRGLLSQVGNLVAQASSKLEITDERQPGNPAAFEFGGVLDPDQQAAQTPCPSTSLAS